MDDKSIPKLSKDPENRFAEYTLSVNKFNQPKVTTGIKAIINKIITLIMMKPGTYPTRPYMGVGLADNYRYTFTDDIPNIKSEVNKQIETYLPELSSVRVEFDTKDSDKTLYIYIIIQKSLYTLLLDTNTRTLSWLNNESQF